LSAGVAYLLGAGDTGWAERRGGESASGAGSMVVKGSWIYTSSPDGKIVYAYRIRPDHRVEYHSKAIARLDRPSGRWPADGKVR